MERCLADDADESPCRQIVLHQWTNVSPQNRRARWQREHRVPEPWVGHIDEAPLLFLSSNPSLASQRPLIAPPARRSTPLASLRGVAASEHPSLNRPFEAPTWEWTDDQVADRYESTFDLWVHDGAQLVTNAQGSLGRPVPYWQAVKALAEAVFGRSVRPGRDYALTEIVHCKSKSEIGVTSAAAECVPRYLPRTLAASPALVIIVLGRKARLAFRREYKYSDADVVSRPLDIEGTERLIVFLSHPSARRRADGRALKYPKNLDAVDRNSVRTVLAEWDRAARFTWEASDVRIVRRPNDR
jgi:hypothetical protein